jgi:hypothetical protein
MSMFLFIISKPCTYGKLITGVIYGSCCGNSICHSRESSESSFFTLEPCFRKGDIADFGFPQQILAIPYLPNPPPSRQGRSPEHDGINYPLDFLRKLSAELAARSLCTTYRYNLISSKCIIPAPPAAGLPFVPKPMATVLTPVRSTPANACRSITHSVHPATCVALASS